MRQRGFSLCEILIVLAVLSMVMAAFGRFMVDGWIGVRRAGRRAEDMQLALILSEAWRGAVGGTDPAGWVAGGAGFTAGQRVVRRAERHLVVSGGMERRVALPAATQCTFAVERRDGAADCAIMNVAWPSRWYRRVVTNCVRLVACGAAGEAGG